DIPFHGPIAGVKVGLVDDEIVINPVEHELGKSKLDLIVAATGTSVVMIESGADEVSEEKMMEAIYIGHKTIKKLVEFQEEFAKEAGKDKMEVELDIISEEIINKVEKKYGKYIEEVANIQGKLERYEAIDKLQEEMLEKVAEELDEEIFEEQERFYKNSFEEIFTKYVRHTILHNNHRVDGRGLDDIRPITCEIDILPRVHGSALFTRGETQSLGTVTLGTGRDEQVVDGLDEEYKKPYFLHYNFPPFSVGEAGFMRSPGRRELGHGALAERALLPMMPTKEEFPYTVRVVSEILESNGSSSMATVCGATLAMMAAGVPIKKPVAGIANGLIMEGDKFVILTDIIGLEDHLGDMDFKVTGTKDGITALQMDIKIEGITKEIMGIALEKAKVGRMFILDKITETIAEPRKELAETAPRIEFFKVDPEKIGEIIGIGGKIIKNIIEVTGANIEIEDNGEVCISSSSANSLKKAKEMINNIISDPEMNKIYDGIVSRIEPFGAFVKIMGGSKEGLVHISQLHFSRINKVEDMLKIGDKVRAKFIGFDKGKIKLSMKGVEGNPEPKHGSTSHRPQKRYDSYGKKPDNRYDYRRGSDKDRDRYRKY
ncbi:MAG: polyribonucleotide nucleotidyltransferase, partial [Candidatus Cloacimonetes bacterium]|nr:polyribonucleotide nucleotidyltransferase [Candidatus Cloacimonadota bacterium]